MRHLALFRLVAFTGLLISLSHLTLTAAAEIRGRVTDAVTGVSLSGAVVSLDPDVVTPENTRTTLTDPFGFFSLNGIPGGTREVVVAHPGYFPKTEAKTFSDGDLLTQDFALEPLVPGQTLITLYGLVVDTKSSLELSGVPVRIRRYHSENASDPAATFVKVTDDFGMVEFNGLPTGWYDFRFNSHESDVEQARPFWESMTIGKKLINTTHSANARLMPIGQDVAFVVEGPNPAMPGPPTNLAGVYVTLTGIRPDFKLPEGFDPAMDSLSDHVIPILPPRTAVTNEDGEVEFRNLPAIPYMVQVQKYGYKKWEEPYLPDDDSGEFDTPKMLFIDLEPTSLQVALESFYDDFLFPDGVPVMLYGLEGTNTEGIQREAPAFFVPFGPPALLPLPTASFDGLLPGRYLVSVNHDKPSPPVPAADSGGTTYTIGFEGRMHVDVAVAETTVESMNLGVIPATIRGRLWVADEVGALETGDSAWGEESPEYYGPIYKPMKQPGIELTETILSDHLPFEVKVVSVDADVDGNFIASVFPGVYSVRIPAMDGYMGSNYELVNAVDGERFSLGWPYDPPDLLAPPFIPVPPLGSYGMIINSRGDYELNLYVRKQLWYLSGDVGADIANHPALRRIVTNKTDPVLTTFFSDLGKGGEMMLELEGGGDALISPLVSKVSGDPGGSRFPASSAEFSFTVPSGTHSLSGTHPNHTIKDPGTGETVFEISLPNLEYPGVLVDPFILPLTEVWGGLPGLPDTLKGEYSGTTTLSIEFRDDAGDEFPVASFNKPDIFRFPGHGTHQFATGFEPFKMVPGSYTIWKNYMGVWYTTTFTVTEGIGSKVIQFTIFTGGGTGSPPPDLTYTLQVDAISDADPTHKIPGLMVNFDDAHTFTTQAPSPFAELAHDGDFVPDSVSPVNQWVPAVGIGNTIASYDIKTDIDSSPPKIDVTLRMRRGMGVKGVVETKLEPEEAGGDLEAVGMVRVMIRNRYGNPLASAITNAAGEFELSKALANAQTLFLEVNAPGFYPFRKRIIPNNLGEDDTPVDIDETITLKPLPGPVAVSGTFNRFGAFLPGVSQSGSGGILTPDEDLEMTCELTSKGNELTLSLVPYDTPMGAPGVVEDMMVVDPVKEIWLVDPRGYPGNPFSEDPVVLAPPLSDDLLFNLKMQRYLDKAVRRTFMEPVEPGVLPFQWFRRFTASPDEETGEYKAAGEVSLATLPPGPFNPLLVAVSQRGAFKVIPITTPGDPNKDLFGMRLPPWAATVADILGTASAVKESGVAINWDNFLPEGFLNPLPEISADIAIVGDGHLKYTYEIGMNIKEGMDLTGTGIAAVMPGFAGTNLKGEMTLEVNGEARKTAGPNRGEISLRADVAATRDAVDIGGYIPKALPKKFRKRAEAFIKKNVDAKLVAGGSVGLKTTEDFIGSQPLERNIQAITSTGISVPISIDITPVVQTIPTVGPVVTALKRTKLDPTFKANIDDAIGTTVTRTFSTRYPHVIRANKASGSTDPLDALPAEAKDHTERRHYLGGSVKPFSKKYDLERALCMRFGVGLEVEIANGRAGASGALTLAGNECRIPTAVGGGTQPAMKITLNQFGDWPPITRIQGKLVGEIEAYLDAWIARLSKKWEFDLIEIDLPFNSEASFDLSPMHVSETLYGLDAAAAADYLGEPPTLIQDLFQPGQVSVDGTGQAVMVFTNVDPETGEMVLQVAHRTGTHAWGPFEELARTGGVVQAGVVALPGGGWLTVWTEIADEDTGGLTPPSTLMFSSSADGVTWSAPASIAALDGVASDFRLVPMAGEAVGLIFLVTDRGPSTNHFSLNAVLFDGSAWGSVQELSPDSIIRDWDAGGPGPTGTGKVEIAAVTVDEKLVVLNWDGVAVTDPTEIVAENVIPPLEMSGGPDDFYSLAYAVNGGGIGFYTKTTGGDWMDKGIVFAGALPGSLTVLDLFDGAGYAYLVAWTEGGSGNVFHGFVDADGGVLVDAVNLTQNLSGDYANLMSTRRGSSHDASLFAFFDNGETTEIRTFDVSRSGGSINNDRDNDTLDDIAEIRMVDYDTNDDVGTVDDVLAGDDFDKDGFTNKEELDAGTDPTNPASFPGQSIEISTEVADCFEFGTVPGQVAIIRSGDGNAEQVVKYQVSGTATGGADYSALAGEVTLAPGIYVQVISIIPEGDALPEGDETVVITLLEDPAYTLGAQTESTVTIRDLPMDQWRLAHFTEAELQNESLTADDSDADGNNLVLVLEYAFGITPNNHEYRNVPVSVVLTHPTSNQAHAGLIYLRPTDALDLEFLIQVTDDLGNWLGGEENIEEVSVSDNGDGSETVVVRDKTPLAGTGRFLRLTVTRSTE